MSTWEREEPQIEERIRLSRAFDGGGAGIIAVAGAREMSGLPLRVSENKVAAVFHSMASHQFLYIG